MTSRPSLRHTTDITETQCKATHNMKTTFHTFQRIFTYGALILSGIMTSCGPAKDIIYIEDLQPEAEITLQPDGELRLQPGDHVSVNVYSRDEELAKMFNINLVGTSLRNQESNYYTVDPQGNIDFPILGNLQVQGLTRMEVAQLIKYRLLSGQLLRDPIVTVHFPDMAFYVIGESGVGRHEFPSDKLNLLEAISISGDLQLSGKRTNVLVLRTEGDRQVPYRVDFTKTDDLYGSPAYYVRQNDMIYVEPTQVKANQSTAHGNNYLTIGFWTSMLSLAATLTVLFTK